MEKRKLEAFCKVYEHRSFSRAGDELGLSQPTISSHIASLEKELKILLFDRIGRNVLPTRGAEVLYKRAIEVLVLLHRAKAEMALLNDSMGGRISIGASTIPVDYLLPQVLAKFRQEFTDVEFDLHTGDSQQVIDWVHEGKFSLGIVGKSEESADLEFIPLFKDRLCIVGQPEFVRQTGCEDMDLQELCKLPWIMREKGSGTRKSFELALFEKGVDHSLLDISVQVRSTQSCLFYGQAGMGLFVTSRLVVERFLQSGQLIALAQNQFEPSRWFYALVHRNRVLLPVEEKLVQCFRSLTASV